MACAPCPRPGPRWLRRSLRSALPRDRSWCPPRQRNRALPNARSTPTSRGSSGRLLAVCCVEAEGDPIRGPGGNAGSEEVLVFGPDRAAQDQGGCQHRPSASVPHLNSGQRFHPCDRIGRLIDGADDGFELGQQRHGWRRIDPATSQDARQVLACVFVAHDRSNEHHVVGVVQDQFTHPMTKTRRIKMFASSTRLRSSKPTGPLYFTLAARAALNSATTSSTSTPFSASSWSKVAAAVRSALMSASRLARVGMKEPTVWPCRVTATGDSEAMKSASPARNSRMPTDVVMTTSLLCITVYTVHRESAGHKVTELRRYLQELTRKLPVPPVSCLTDWPYAARSGLRASAGARGGRRGEHLLPRGLGLAPGRARGSHCRNGFGRGRDGSGIRTACRRPGRDAP